MQRQRIGVRKAGAAHRRISVDRHADQSHRFQSAEDAADRQPVGRDTDPVVVVRGTKNAGDEDQADDHVQPFLQDLAVGTGQPDQKIGQETTLDHFPYAFHPQVNRPPAVEDGDGVIFKLQQGRQIQQCGKAQAQHQHPLGGREAARLPDRHANVVEENQHADDNHDLVR